MKTLSNFTIGNFFIIFFFKYGDDPKEVMTSGTEWKKGPSSKMFKKLFR